MAADTRYSKHTSAEAAMELARSTRGRDFADLVIVITGANSGIGYEAAVALARGGATVVTVCRNKTKAEETAKRVREAANEKDAEKVVPGVMDCGSLDSVRAFAAAYKAGSIVKSCQLNVIVNNAGIMQLPKFTPSQDGIESQFAVNFLAGYLLVEELIPLLKASASPALPSRIVNVSSAAHYTFKMERWAPDQLPMTADNYNSWQEYAMSKMCQILHTKALDARLKDDQEHPVRAVSLHPGVIQTKLGRSAACCSITWWLYAFPRVALALGFHKTLEAGAAPTVRCCLDPKLFETDGPYPIVFISDDCQPRAPSLPPNSAQASTALLAKAAELVSNH